MKKLSSLYWLPLLLIAFITGCEDQKGLALGVVDLDKVATSTGQMRVIEEDIRLFAEDTQTTLNQIKDELNVQIETAREGLGQKPSQQEQAEFQKATLTAQLTLKQELAQGEKLIAQKRAQLILDYRHSIEPAIRRVATQAGIKVVLIKQPNLLYIDSGVDVTDAVIDAVQAMPAALDTPAKNSTEE